MSRRPNLFWPDPVLSRRAEEVTAFDADLSALVAEMFETMYAAPGRGLAAPQIGVLRRVFVTDATWKDGARSPRVFVNPTILRTAGETATGDEGCLSIPGLLVPVARPLWVEMAWQDPDGRRHEARIEGSEAMIVQHEADHLDGVVTLDRVAPELRPGLEAAYRAGAA